MEYIESNRIGRFEVLFAFINKMPDSARVVMGECIVIDVELQHYNGKAVYTALSDWFDIVGIGEPIPLYVWELETSDDGPKIKGCEKTDRIIY